MQCKIQSDASMKWKQILKQSSARYSLNQLINIVQFVQTVLFTYRYLYDKDERPCRYWLFVYPVTGNAVSHQISVVLHLMITSHRTHHNHSLSMTSYNLISVQMIPLLNMLTSADIVTVIQLLQLYSASDSMFYPLTMGALQIVFMIMIIWLWLWLFNERYWIN